MPADSDSYDLRRYLIGKAGGSLIRVYDSIRCALRVNIGVMEHIFVMVVILIHC